MIEEFVKLLNPFAPHVAEEIWHERLGNEPSVNREAWPVHDPALLEQSEVEIVIQVNGKLRGRLSVAKDTPKDEVEKLALQVDSIGGHIEGKTIRRVIVVPGKLVNIVAN